MLRFGTVYADRDYPVANATRAGQYSSLRRKEWKYSICQLTLQHAALDRRTAGLLAKEDAVLIGTAFREAAMLFVERRDVGAEGDLTF